MRSDIPFALNIPCQLKCLGTIVDCMKDPSKCVSDDTCLERILRIFLQVLVENPEGAAKFFRTDASVFKSCHHIINHLAEYTKSSSSFVIRLLGVLANDSTFLYGLDANAFDCLMLCLTDLLNLPFSEDSNQVSIHCAWLQTVLEIMSNDRLMQEVFIPNVDFCKLGLLMTSRSIYVKETSIKCLSKLLVYVVKFKKSSVNCAVFDSADPENSVNNVILSAAGALQSFLHDLPLNSALQVATTGAKHDATLSDAVWHFGLPSMGETWVKQSLAAMADACDAALVDFLSVLYSRPSSQKDEPLVATDVAWNLSMRMLVKHPLNKSGYTAASQIALFNSAYREQCLGLIILPFKIALAEAEVPDLAEAVADEWLCVTRQNLATKSKMCALLGNSLNAWHSMWMAGTCPDRVERSVLAYLDLSLSCSFDLPKANTVTGRQVLPGLFQNSKLGASIVACLKKCVSHPRLSEKCLHCFLGPMTDTLLEALAQPGTDHKAWTTSGFVVCAAVSHKSTCHCHVKENSRKLESLMRSLWSKCEHPDWEMKDSALELLGSLVRAVCVRRDEDLLIAFRRFSSHFALHDTALACAGHSNSFVRATALDACAALAGDQDCGAKFLDELCAESLRILREDDDAFGRRAAVRVMSTYVCRNLTSLMTFANCMQADKGHAGYSATESGAELVRKTARCVVDFALNDLDWEVQRGAVDLLSEVYDRLLRSDPARWEEHNFEMVAFSNKLHLLLSPLLDWGNVTVRERAVDLMQAAGARQLSASVLSREKLEQRKRSAIVHELTYLLDDVLYAMNNSNLADVQTVSRDCY